MILALKDAENGDYVAVNSDAINSMRSIEGGTAIFLRDGQREDVAEHINDIVGMAGSRWAANKRSEAVTAIDDARRTLDVWSKNRMVDDEIWFVRVNDMMGKLGRIENAVLA